MHPKVKILILRTQLPALKLMEAREKAPKQRDTTELPDGTKLGLFWMDCKHKSKCGRPPYDRLLTNPVLRADYRTGPTTATREISKERICCGPHQPKRGSGSCG